MITKEYILEKIQKTQNILDALKENSSGTDGISSAAIAFQVGKLYAFQEIIEELKF